MRLGDANLRAVLLVCAEASVQPCRWSHLHATLLAEDGAQPSTVPVYSLDMLL